MHQSNSVEFATTRLSTGLQVHYAQQGDRDGETIVFLHAYVDSWFSYARVLPLLSYEYHAFAFDQRGHGDSDKPQCCYTVDDFAAYVDAETYARLNVVERCVNRIKRWRTPWLRATRSRPRTTGRW